MCIRYLATELINWLYSLLDANTTYYFSTLTAASELSPRFKVDAAGEYTLGSFRIDLVPPKKLEKTVIEIQININPK